METQIAWRVMAVMFDDVSTCLASCAWSNTLASQKEDSRLYGIHRWASVKWQQETNRGIWKEKHDHSDMIVADQLCK